MKELLESGVFGTPKDETREERLARKRETLVHQMKFRRGLQLWEYDKVKKTLTCKETVNTTQYETISSTHGREIVSRRVQVKRDCVYFQALNRVNALKKLRANGYEIDEKRR